MVWRKFRQQELELVLALHAAGCQELLHQLEDRDDVALLDRLAFRILGGQVFRHQQEHGGKQALGRVVEVGVLPVLGAVPGGIDQGLGEDLGILLRLGLGRQIFGVSLVDVHILVDQVEQIIAVRAGRVAQIQHGDLKAVALLGDPRIVAEQVALGVRAEEGHPSGQSVFDIGIKKIGRLARAAGGGDQGVDIVCVHDGDDMVLAPLTPQDQPLLFGEALTFSPLLRSEGDVSIGLLDLFLGGPSCGSMLAVSYSLGLDVVQGALSGKVGHRGKEKKGASCQCQQEDRLHIHALTPSPFPAPVSAFPSLSVHPHHS